MKQFEKKNLKNYNWKKRKIDEYFVFDTYINQINRITISQKDGKSIINIEELNSIIVKLPAYMRKKKMVSSKKLSIEFNVINYKYTSCEKKKNMIHKEENLNNKSVDIKKKEPKENEKNLVFKVEIKSLNESNKSNIISDNLKNNKSNVINNDKFKNLVNKPIPINKDEFQTLEIVGDGNCFYRCLSFFLLSDDQYYKEIKNEIIKWIDNNKELYLDFFGEDEKNNISKEHSAEEEYNYIKQKDSWGGYHTIEIACLVFNISIGIYTDNGNNEYLRYSYSENSNKDAELMLLHYLNNNHFNLLYDKNIELNKQEKKFEALSIKNKKNNTKDIIKYEGKKFSNNYVLTKYKGGETIYDEISNYLKSIQKNENLINIQKNNHPKWHINQIYALFNLEYPERLSNQSDNNKDKRRIFRKEAEKYKLDKNNRLTILNPLNKDNDEIYYKIPFLHEKDILVMQIHIDNNHAGRDAVIELLHKENWYWYGMNKDIANIIKICPLCNKPFKFKSLSKKKKIILDEGPHFRYVADIWYLCNEIKAETGYNYVLDVIDHFSKWYNGYLLKTKEAKEVLKKIELFIENFGECKILQVDNGTEFKNNLLQTYCNNKNIKLIHSSPYHPQTNGVIEVVHKEIRKYIYTEFFKNKENFDIEEELFNITKIHNNKIHSTTKRIPREIKDLEDREEIEVINREILKNLSKLNKNYDVVDYNKSYVIDYNKIYKSNGVIYKKKGKIKNKKKLVKIPVKLISECNSELSEYIIEIKKDCNNFKEGESYKISMDILEEVDSKLWEELVK